MLLTAVVLCGPAALAAPVPMRPVSFEERVAAREALERVYDALRIWPRENPAPKPSFEERLPRSVIEGKVRDDLRKDAALARARRRPVTAEELQAEMDRMARETKAPAVLRELFGALGDEPVLIAECLARPILTERLLRSWEVAVGPDEDAHTPRPIVPVPAGSVTTPVLAPATCDGWIPSATLNSPLDARTDHTAVWTGSEMIVWGGVRKAGQYFASGSRYRPSTDTWSATSNGPGCPSARLQHTAVWTGTEMIVWGGYGSPGHTNTGGRYDPVTDTWTTTSSGAGCPSPRSLHTAVWTGNEMIVWGGGPSTESNTGGRYAPATDSWVPTSTGVACPEERLAHSAVWTGTEMIVWGGANFSGELRSGGRYDPVADSWTATSTGVSCPSARGAHSAIWTGSEMIVWGGNDGQYVNTGARYTPASDTWATMSAGPGCPTARGFHTAVWAGTRMIVWGGKFLTGKRGDGGRYDPSSDQWSATSTGAGNPTARTGHTAVWTGSEMIVWGGMDALSVSQATGSRYDPVVDGWTPTAGTSAPSARYWHTAVWTGAEMVVWGGGASDLSVDGGRYDPARDAWLPMSVAGAPAGRVAHTAVWTGLQMIVWGGSGATAPLDTGGRYDPATDTWQATSTGGSCPTPRNGHSAVWTGAEMIVWGGGGSTNTGGRYDPLSDSWRATATGTAPPGMAWHAAVWTGTEMIVYRSPTRCGRYDPVTDGWTTMSALGAPSRRDGSTAIWTGSEMIVWGGTARPTGNALDDGARYDPRTDTWTPTSTAPPCPSGRSGGTFTTVWTGAEMIVWGGASTNTGGRYDPATDTWIATPTVGACPSPRSQHTAVWTGTSMIVWGGLPSTSTGGIYVPPCAADYLVGAGAGQPNPPTVRIYAPSGASTPVAFAAYGSSQWGVNVASGDLDGGTSDEILTGPGPGDVFGPHVRGWDRAGASIAKVNFFAYGTLKFGTNVTAGDVEDDGYDEILTGAGPGSVFGPHVRGFDFDNVAVAVMAKLNFFSYGTLQWGVNVADGSVDADAPAEIATGPGPGPTFSPQVRGFDYDGVALGAIAKINYNAVPYGGYGVRSALGDVDADGYAEIASTPGPGPAHPWRYLGHGYDGSAIVLLPGYDVTPFAGVGYGGRVGIGDLEPDGREDLLCGSGPDPAADSKVIGYRYTASQQLQRLPVTITPFLTLRYGVNPAAGDYMY